MSRIRRLLAVFTVGVAFSVFSPPTASAQTCERPINVSFLEVGPITDEYHFDVRDTNQCGWTAEKSIGLATDDWVLFTGGFSGRGAGRVTFRVQFYTGASFRATVIRAGEELLVIRQSSVIRPPTVVLSPPVIYTDDVFSSVSTRVTAPAGRSWTADRQGASNFLVATKGSGIGPGTLELNVAYNASTRVRAGLVRVDDALLTVVQKPAGSVTCDETLVSVSPVSLVFDAAGGRKAVLLTAPPICTVTANSSASWIRVSPTRATGSTTFSIALTAATASRSGSAVIGRRSVTIEQRVGTIPAPSDCSVTPTSFVVPVGGGSFDVAVRSRGCPPWSVVIPPSLSTVVNATPMSGTGDAIVRVRVVANTGGARALAIQVAGHTVIFAQAGRSPSCVDFTLSASTVSFPAAGGTRSVRVTAPQTCDWLFIGMGTGIGVSPASGRGAGTVVITATPNGARQPRDVTLMVADVSLRVTQDGAPCTYSVSRSSIEISRDGGAAAIDVLSQNDCSAATVTAPSWLGVHERTDAGGTGRIVLSAAANPQPASRSGVVTVGNTRVTVAQAGAPPDGTTFDGSNRSSPMYRVGAAFHLPGGTVVHYGYASDQVSLVDGDGDGILDVRIYQTNPSTSMFYLRPSSQQCPTLYEFGGTTGDGHLVCQRPFGREGDVPVRIDLDDDSIDDLAIFRSGTGTWYITTTTGACTASVPARERGYDGRAICAVDFGLPGDVPFVRDWNGDGVDDLAVWHTSTQWLEILPTFGGCPDNRCRFQWGLPGDTPVVGAFADDGIVMFGVYRPSDGNWILASTTGRCPSPGDAAYPAFDGLTACVTKFGLWSDIVVPMDYNGDGTTDKALFRPATNEWLVLPVNGECPPAVPTTFLHAGQVACQAVFGAPGAQPLSGSR